MTDLVEKVAIFGLAAPGKPEKKGHPIKHLPFHQEFEDFTYVIFGKYLGKGTSGSWITCFVFSKKKKINSYETQELYWNVEQPVEEFLQPKFTWSKNPT